MKIILTADWQISSSRLQRGLDLISSVRKTALREEVSDVFVIGDLLDDKERHTIDCLLGVAQEFRKYREDGVTLYWIRGNHEVPVASQPHRTIMDVFSDTCHTIIKPQVLRFEDEVAVYCLPWYPPKRFKSYCDWAAKETFTDKDKCRIFLGHIGLNEGVFDSGTHKEQPTSLKDLHIDNYHWVALGDYHTHQKLAPRTYYVGTPISHRFGEENPNRVWVFDTEVRGWKSCALVDSFPGHFTWDVKSYEDLKSIDLSQINKIRCAVQDAPELRRKYAGHNIIWETYGTAAVTPIGGRSRVTSDHTDKQILKQFLANKGWEETHGELAFKYLKAAQRRIGNVS